MASVSGDSLTVPLFERLQLNSSLRPAAAAGGPATSDGQVQRRMREIVTNRENRRAERHRTVH
jgi:hypothetical protein